MLPNSKEEFIYEERHSILRRVYSVKYLLRASLEILEKSMRPLTLDLTTILITSKRTKTISTL